MKKAQKTLALLTAAALTAGVLAGCGGSGASRADSGMTKPADSAGNAGTAETGADPSDFTYPMSDRSLTYWCELSDNIGSYYKNLGDTPFGKGLMEKTGVAITFQHPPAGGADEQFNLLVADGDLPDVIEYHWQSYPGGPEKAISDGVIVPLNDIIDQYCPNLKAYLDANPETARQCRTDDGHYYAFPFIRGDDQLRVTQGLFLRQDWLDELGMEIPTTIEEWHAVLKAFKDKKGATAPFAYVYTNDQLTDNNPFAYAYNTTRNFYVGDDGMVHFGAAEENYKQYLQTMHDWYAEGLLDPDMLTSTYETVSAKVSNGSAGAAYGWPGSCMGVWSFAGMENDPNFNMQPCPQPSSEKGVPAKMGQIDNICPNQGMVAISTSCKDVETAARLLDWAYGEEGHLYYNFGTEGVSYEMKDGIPTYTDLIMHNPDGLAIATAMSHYIRGNYNGPFVQDLNYLKQYYTLDGQKKAVATWTVETASKHTLPNITPTAEESEEFSTIMNEVKTYRDEMTNKFILGTESLDNFDQYVETLNSLGLQRAIDIENAALERYNMR